MADEARIAKLPVWAQDYIAELRLQLRDAKRAHEEALLATAPEESDTLVRRYSKGSIGLGKGTWVRFNLDGTGEDGGEPRQYIDARVEDGQLYLNGGNQLVVLPQVTNVVRVGVQSR